MTVAEIIKQCKATLEDYYGPRLRGLVVYGSEARTQATPASDIDLLVLLSEPFDYFHELRKIIDLLIPSNWNPTDSAEGFLKAIQLLLH